jgi:hypothetical protein
MNTSNDTSEDMLAKGFNSGYTLARHNPALLNTLLSGVDAKNSSSVYVQGLAAGKNQYEQDKQHQLQKEKEKLFAQLKAKETQKQKDKGRDAGR